MRRPQTHVSNLITVLFITSIIYFFANFHRLSLNVLCFPISEALGLNSSQIGLLGSALFYAYATMQIPCGIFADKMSPRVLISAACVFTALSTILFALTESYAVMFTARLLTGAATALVYIPALSAVRSAADNRTVGTATGMLVCAGQTGAACASSPLLFLSKLVGWRFTLVAIGLIMLAVAVPAWLFLPRNFHRKNELSPQGELPSIAGAGKNRYGILVMLSLWFFITCGTRTSFQGLFGSSFFIIGKETSDNAAGFYMTLISVGGIVGAVSFGRLCDRFGAPLMLLLSTAFLAAGWALLAFTPGSCQILLCATVVIIGLVGAGSATALFCSMNLISKANNRGFMTGVANFAAFTGTALITQLNGKVLDILPVNGLDEKYSALMLVFCLACVLSLPMVLILFKNFGFNKTVHY